MTCSSSNLRTFNLEENKETLGDLTPQQARTKGLRDACSARYLESKLPHNLLGRVSGH